MCVSIFYTTFYTFVGAPVNLQGNQFYIFIFSFVLAGHVDHEEHNTYSLFFLLAGHVDHEEHNTYSLFFLLAGHVDHEEHILLFFFTCKVILTTRNIFISFFFTCRQFFYYLFFYFQAISWPPGTYLLAVFYLKLMFLLSVFLLAGHVDHQEHIY